MLTRDLFGAGDYMQGLKTGYLTHASPQFYGQLVGSCLSIVVATIAFKLYQRASEISGSSFSARTASVYLGHGLARLLRTCMFCSSTPPHFATNVIRGVHGELPEKCGVSIVLLAVLFGLMEAKTYVG